MQACISSSETGCAIGREFKDNKEGQEECWLSVLTTRAEGEGEIVRIQVLSVQFLPGDHGTGLRLAG